jgi:hypothetical protein
MHTPASPPPHPAAVDGHAGRAAGSPAAPAGQRRAPALLPVVAVVGSLAVGIAAPIGVGGIAWLGAALLVGASVAWLALVLQFGPGRDAAPGANRRTGDTAAPRRSRLAPTIAIVVAAVVAGVILVGAIGGYLASRQRRSRRATPRGSASRPSAPGSIQKAGSPTRGWTVCSVPAGHRPTHARKPPPAVPRRRSPEDGAGAAGGGEGSPNPVATPP